MIVSRACAIIYEYEKLARIIIIEMLNNSITLPGVRIFDATKSSKVN